MMRHLFSIFVFALILMLSSLSGQNITLVDFGNTEANNTFEMTGWNQLLKADPITYTGNGPGGLSFGADFDEYTDFMGVKGTSRQFTVGERIVVTWYNNSDEIIYFTSRISFTDEDEPSGGTSDGSWFTMRSFTDYREALTEIPANSSAKTVFNITNSGVHKSDEEYSLVNINIAIEWGETVYKQYLICDKIELFNDADITPPTAPGNLASSTISNAKAELTWNASTDDVGVVEYLIYNDGVVEGYSRTNSYSLDLLEANTTYSMYVTALDACGNESPQSAPINVLTTPLQGQDVERTDPLGISYLGAFRLPEEFSYGAEAIAYCGYYGGGMVDANGQSLFVTDLNQPQAGFVGEVSIPELVNSATNDIDELNTATILQTPANIRPDNVNAWDYVDIWRTGLEYDLNADILYSSWSIHYTVSGEKQASISCCNASDLAGSEKLGAWYLGDPASPPIAAMANDYLFIKPTTTANINQPDYPMVCGRFRDGGLSGLGPTMYSFDMIGDTPPEPNSVLEISTILEYGSVDGTDNYNYPNSITLYNHADSWKGADYITSGPQHSIAVVGNKALGNNWYGYYGEEMRNTWVFADVPYPDFYETDPDGKGWRSHSLIPMIMFYDYDDILSVVTGILNSYEPQPYAALRFDKDIFFNDLCEIRSMAFDEQNSQMYIAEFDPAHDGAIIIHVFHVGFIMDLEDDNSIPTGYRLEQNYPNPFNPSTTINYSIPVEDTFNASTANVKLTIYDVLGCKVSELVNESQPAGNYKVTFNAGDLSSGIYYYTLETGAYRETKKMMLVK